MNQAGAVNIDTINRLYTLDEARQLLLQEAEREQRQREQERVNHRRERRYFAKQKLVGLALIAISMILLLITKDATAAVFMIPVGLLVMLTKARVLTE